MYIRISTRKRKRIENSLIEIRKLYSTVCAGGQAEVEERGRAEAASLEVAQMRNRIVHITPPNTPLLLQYFYHRTSRNSIQFFHYINVKNP